jgi:signal transduction histidine kinase
MGWLPEVQSGLFDAFTQADVTVTKKFGGLGLGLAISKAVILAHQGTLNARSGGLEQGAVFTVRLPLRRQE